MLILEALIKIQYSYIFGILLFFGGLPDMLYAQDSPLVLTEKSFFIHLNSYAKILEDPTGALTLTEVTLTPERFSPILHSTMKQNKQLDMGFTQSAFWLKVNVVNQSDTLHWYFTQYGSLSRQTQVYLHLDDQKKQAFIPLKRVHHSRDKQYLFYFPQQTYATLYFRIQDKQAPLVINPYLQSATHLVERTQTMDPLFMLISGGLLILSLYNFLYFIHLRDGGFLALSIFILMFVLEIGNHSGLLNYHPFLYENLQFAGSLFAFALIAAGISLFDNWLNIKKYLPYHHTQLRIAFWINCGLVIASPFIPYYSVALSGLWGLFIFILLGKVTVFFVRKGLHLPWSMSLAAFIFTISAIPSLLRAVGFAEDRPWIINLTFVTLLISILLLSLTQAEQVKQKAKKAERITASNKAKDEFLTTMSHELRTPMNAVVGAAHLLELTTLSSEQKNYVSRLNTSSSHMLSLINDILDLARLNTSLLGLEKISFKLDTIVQAVKQLSQQQAENKQLTLQVNQHFSLLDKQLQGDPTRLQQILLNLLNNAIKFTPQGSVELNITLQRIDHQQAALLFEVIDTGIGLSKQQQSKLFKPFMQAKNSTSRQYGGSGLGLAISHKLVKRMGGNLAVESSLKQGSRFFFSLNFPLKKRVNKQEKLSSAPESHLSTEFLQAFCVLLVDDDEMNRFFGQKILKACGVKAFVAESGKDVLQQLEEKTFDLIFMDVSMPDMDGYETTRRLRADQRFIHLPVIALTAHAIAGERERCLEAGMDDYLTKPFKMEQLKDMIKYWADKSRIKIKCL